MSKLAIKGGSKAITLDQEKRFVWPQMTNEEEAAVVALIKKGEISVSQEQRKFEKEFKQYINMPYALAEVNGTAALHSAFHAIGLSEGDEIITVSYTYWATIMPAAVCGAKVVFSEIDPKTLNIDPADVEKRINPRTKAIVAVHLWGLPCNMEALKNISEKHGLWLIEDASHAHGAMYHGKKAGSLAPISIFSFQASKNLPAGEGGMLLTTDEEIYNKAVVFGHYRETAELPEPYNKYQHTSGGFKYRMSPLHAAIGRIQLRYLDERNKKRNQNIITLSKTLLKIPGFSIPEISDGVYRVYYENNVVYNEEETGVPVTTLIDTLQAEGVRIRRTRYPLLHMQPFFVERGSNPDDLPVTRKTVKQVVTLPTFPSDDGALVEQYIEAFQKVAENLLT